MAPRFVVGIDGSEGSRNALVWALGFAGEHGASVDAVMSWQYPAVAFTAAGAAIALPPSAEMEDATAASLDRLLDEWIAAPPAGVTIEPTVAEGSAGTALCDLAADADLLVVGSRGLGGFKGLILGSVSAHCANAAPCPVVIVPEDPERSAATIDRATVGVDGSAGSHAAVQWADEWAPAAATIELVHAWDHPIVYQLADLEIDPTASIEASSATLAEATALVHKHRCETASVRGDARSIMTQRAETADLLVVGARGHHGLERLMVGSVASTVVHHLAVPTAVVHTPPEE